MVKMIFSSLLFLVLLFQGVCSAALVKTEGGNIVYTDDAGKTIQLTSSGRDKDAVIHPKGQWIYFIRSFEGKFEGEKYVAPKGKKIEPGILKEELWRVKTNGTEAKMLYQSQYTAIDGPDPDYSVAFVGNIQFSPAGDKVYFETQQWVTDFGLHRMNVDGSGEELLGPGANTRVITSARTFDGREKSYRGYLVTAQHRYFFYGGSYDWFYLFTPDLKKEIAPLGEDLKYFTDAGEIKYTDGSEKNITQE